MSPTMRRTQLNAVDDIRLLGRSRIQQEGSRHERRGQRTLRFMLAVVVVAAAAPSSAGHALRRGAAQPAYGVIEQQRLLSPLLQDPPRRRLCERRQQTAAGHCCQPPADADAAIPRHVRHLHRRPKLQQLPSARLLTEEDDWRADEGWPSQRLSPPRPALCRLTAPPPQRRAAPPLADRLPRRPRAQPPRPLPAPRRVSEQALRAAEQRRRPSAHPAPAAEFPTPPKAPPTVSRAEAARFWARREKARRAAAPAPHPACRRLCPPPAARRCAERRHLRPRKPRGRRLPLERRSTCLCAGTARRGEPAMQQEAVAGEKKSAVDRAESQQRRQEPQRGLACASLFRVCVRAESTR